VEPYVINLDTDGYTVITHPSGARQVLPREFVERMETQRRAIRQGMIDNNPCGFNCPAGRPYSCGCDQCEKREGFFEPDELDQFSKLQRDLIASKWKPDDGFLGPDGCRLPRYLRSLQCLSFVCMEN
jgi:hypothetical protein